MAELHIRNGKLGTEIADAAGEFRDYALRRLGPGVYRVTREDTGADYCVQHTLRGWVCSCDAYKYRNARNRKTYPGTCKHCVAVAEIDQVLQALARGDPAHVR